MSNSRILFRKITQFCEAKFGADELFRGAKDDYLQHILWIDVDHPLNIVHRFDLCFGANHHIL